MVMRMNETRGPERAPARRAEAGLPPGSRSTRSGRRLGRICAAAAFALAFGAGSLAAQDYRTGVGYNAGGIWFSDLNSGATGEAGIAPAAIALDPGWIIGLQAEHWIGSGRIGGRLNGALTQRPLDLPGRDRDISVWMLDADLLLRLLPAEPDRVFNMFLSLGAGAVRYKLGSGDPVHFAAGDASHDGDDGPQLAAAGGVGFDFLTAWTWDRQPIGVRFEVVDHVSLESPLDPISGSDFSPVHNVRLVIGLFTGVGSLRR